MLVLGGVLVLAPSTLYGKDYSLEQHPIYTFMMRLDYICAYKCMDHSNSNTIGRGYKIII